MGLTEPQATYKQGSQDQWGEVAPPSVLSSKWQSNTDSSEQFRA